MDLSDLAQLSAAGHPLPGVAMAPPGDPSLHVPVPVPLPFPLGEEEEASPRRSAAAHFRLVDALQQHHLADDLEPPSESASWPADLLAHWFEHGGRLLPHERAA
eukprot:CAMPEP_0202779746 /NCGR_PEP_ID=MMETSP1388-20130828/57330_1 /ASSEMBLY_ACC=CAM_ASM_000864 /TAXON_ID=37098 /ORGANISM="Isochrysis sp, Strain CCMP1244" /LENGTH=103 /DNA_ID=CAMNT_0049449095 /DNA_START=36 /DNA_END=343 /DNA_ORIENTATION=+